MRKSVSAIVAVSGLAVGASSAMAIVPRVIYSEVASSSTSQIGGGTIESIDRPYKSLNGQNWTIRINLLTGGTITAANDDLVVSGSGVSGTVRAQQGVTLLDGARTADADFQQRLSINDQGNIAFAGSLSGATTDDGVIFRAVGSTYSVHAREGTAVPSIANAFYGTTPSAPNIDNSDRVHFRSFGMTGTGAPTGTTVAVFRNDGSVLDGRTGTTVPAGQQGTPSTWQNIASGSGFNQGNYHVDATGSNWLVTGDTNAADGTQDALVVFNGSVVLQEGFAIPGSSNPSPVVGFNEAGMAPDGHWWVRGSYGGNSTATDGPDWVVGNGAMIAMSGDTITPSSTETWLSSAAFLETFFLYEPDTAGNYVIGGVTDAADTLRNAVLVYNGTTEIIREGDAVDLDGNGLLDDGVFINTFGNDDAILAPDGTLHFVATLKDASGTSLGDAFITMTVPTPGALALLAFGAAAVGRRRR